LKTCRNDCYTGCNIGFFPELECQTSQHISFTYNGDFYNDFFIYKMPDPAVGEEDSSQYQMCQSYIANNPDFPFIAFEDRQARIHTCFSYCITSADPAVVGETRPNCVDLAPT